MKKEYLLAPGPTAVSAETLLEMARPVFHHRTNRYRKIFQEVTENLKIVFKTKNDVLTFSGSGTAAMEASVVNILSPGDTAIVVNSGKFGERWGHLCKAFGVKALEIKVDNGKAVDPAQVAKLLKENPSVKAVYTTLCETSTGVVTDIQAIGKIVKESPAVLVVDAVSGLGADDLQTDNWNVDIAVSGSQKGLMIPPGLSFATVSPKAWGLEAKSTMPKFYLSFKKAKKSLADWDNPFTPPVTLIIGLRHALAMIVKEGMDNVLKRHALLAAATRAAVKALGMELFSVTPANTLTAVATPAGVDGVRIVKDLREEMGVTIAGAQGDELKGKLFRVAHLGYAVEFDVMTAISALELALKRQNYRFTPGAGVKAAQEVLVAASTYAQAPATAPQPIAVQ